jgi:uncharacterized protein DUF3592
MQIVFSGFLAFGGLVALLAGGYGLQRTRDIIAGGEVAVAVVKPPLPDTALPLLQFETADGRVMEIVSPVVLRAGTVVRLRYDPADPREVALPDHRRTWLDLGFVLLGAVVILAAVVLVATSF